MQHHDGPVRMAMCKARIHLGNTSSSSLYQSKSFNCLSVCFYQEETAHHYLRKISLHIVPYPRKPPAESPPISATKPLPVEHPHAQQQGGTGALSLQLRLKIQPQAEESPGIKEQGGISFFTIPAPSGMKRKFRMLLGEEGFVSQGKLAYSLYL